MSLHQKTTLQARLCWHDGGITLFLSFLEQTNWLAAYDTRACAMLGKFFVSDSTGLELVQELYSPYKLCDAVSPVPVPLS